MRVGFFEMKKLTRCNELSFIVGTVFCALGVCLTIKSGFGLSMIAAPPYILHHKIAHYAEWFSHGMAEALWQLFVMIVMVIAVERFNHRYLYSFGAAIISSVLIDFWLMIFGGIGVYSTLAARIICFIFGELITAFSIACLFRTTLPLQIHELIVVEISEKYKIREEKVKFANDILLLVISLALALLLNHSFDGIGVGTVIITMVNAPLIRMFGHFLDMHFEFESAFPKITEKLSV